MNNTNSNRPLTSHGSRTRAGQSDTNQATLGDAVQGTPRTSQNEYEDSPGMSLETAMQDLWSLVDRYTPQDTKLETELKCFDAEYMPSIGDIDPMLKIPKPKPVSGRRLGVHVVDEPATVQSNPTIIDLKLRALSKLGQRSATGAEEVIRSIDMQRPDASRTLAQFCNSVLEVHSNLQPDKVLYSKRMPNVEKLMDLWDQSAGGAQNGDANNNVEAEMVALATKFMKPAKDGKCSLASLDFSLKEYAELSCLMVDTPVYESDLTKSVPGKTTSRHLVESMHVLFNLYLEFKVNPHFSKYSVQ